MDLIVAGHCPQLQWIAERLRAAGHRLAPAAGDDDGCALFAPGLRLELSDHAPADWDALAGQHAGALVDVSGPWHPLGARYGFCLYAGGDAAALDTARPLLDALAPAPGAWLACGPLGSASFVHQVLDALLFACGLLGRAGWSSPGERPSPPDWAALFAEQRLLAAQLLRLAQRYLAHHPAPQAPTDALLAALATPPGQHPHYAQLLAQWLQLGLEHDEHLQRVFDALGAGAPARQ